MMNRWSGWQRRALAEAAPAPPQQTPTETVPETTFFDADCNIDGKLVMQTSIEIAGEFRGEIECGQTVTVGPDAAVEGSIHARSVEIRGAVLGDVVASRELVLRGSGRITGDVDTPCFVLERGAFFNGATRMYRPELVARTAAVPRPMPGDDETLGTEPRPDEKSA